MGFFKNVANSVRSYWEKDKSRAIVRVAKGTTRSPSGVFSPYLAAIGYDYMNERLRVDQALNQRYMDYEEMDEYPIISCLAGSSRVFTLEWGWITIEELSLYKEPFHVISYDFERESLVPAKATRAKCTGKPGHGKPMVRVVFDNGQYIECTADHLFLTKEGEWVKAGDLGCGDRLMPGLLCMRTLNSEAAQSVYWRVQQPHAGRGLRSTDGKRWMWLHKLVASEFLDREPGSGDIVHHGGGDTLNNAPSNLSIEDHASHAKHHIAKLDNSQYFPEWTPSRRKAQAEKMRGNTYSRGNKLSAETRRKMSAASKGKPKSEKHRGNISLGQRMQISRERIESALNEGGTIARAAKILGVSWSTVKRRADEFDLLRPGGNHRVFKVDKLYGEHYVYDLEVPEYRNFVCDGVVVHNSALDIFADDATQPETSKDNRTIWITSDQEGVQDSLNDLMNKRLRMDEEIWEIARSLCKYGNDYEELIVSEEGVVAINFLPAPSVRRVEGRRGELIGFVQDMKMKFPGTRLEWIQLIEQRSRQSDSTEPEDDYPKLVVFEDWEVVHMRLRSKYRRSVYGYSILEPARYIWKRLMFLEDAAMLYRLQRAPERYAFYVDCGDLPPMEALAYVNRVRQMFKKKKIVNSQNRLDFRFDPLNSEDDFFVPSRQGNDSTRIEVLGSPQWQSVDDIEYFQEILFAAIKIPKAYLGKEEGVVRSVLSSEDVRFARTILRIQRELKNGLNKVCRVDLAARNVDPDSVKYEIHMTVPSAIFELAQLEVRNARADLAGRMADFVSIPWLLTKVFDLPEEEAEEIIKQRSVDAFRAAVDTGKGEAEAQKIINKAVGGAAGAAGAAGAFASVEPTIPAMLEALRTRTRARSRERGFPVGGFTAEEMKRANEAQEARMTARLKELLKNDRQLQRQLEDLRGLLQAMRQR